MDTLVTIAWPNVTVHAQVVTKLMASVIEVVILDGRAATAKEVRITLLYTFHWKNKKAILSIYNVTFEEHYSNTASFLKKKWPVNKFLHTTN